MIVPNITLKNIDITKIIPVFLKPINKYLLFKTFLKLSNVILLHSGNNNGEVVTISAFVFNDANSVKRIGANTITTIPKHKTCFKS